MATLTHTSEIIGTLELRDMRDNSLTRAGAVSSSYHYGASESNVTYPEGMLERVTLKAGNGRYSGIGVAVDALDKSTLLTDKRLKAQQAIVQEMIESLEENGKGTFEVKKVVVLFNPIKLFVLLSNGNEADDIVYMSVNGRSNGSGQRKELNWPEGVLTSSKRARREYWEKQLKKAEKKLANILKSIAKFDAGTVVETYKGEEKSLRTWKLEIAKESVEQLKKKMEQLA